MKNKDEGEKGRWIGIHLQPLIHLNSFCLIIKDYDWLKMIRIYYFKFYVSGEGLAPIVSAYSRLILVDGTVL